MLSPLRTFARDETGAVSADWVVLTAFLVGTALSVLTTVRGGVEFTSVEVANQLRGQPIQSSFADPRCPSGLAGVQRQEAINAAAAGREEIRVSAWLQTNPAIASNTAIEQELSRLRAAVGDEGGGITADGTYLAALQCQAVINGL